MLDALILGGTRDIGHFAALALLQAGHSVAILNRGRTPDELPPDIERIRADRTQTGAMKRALGARRFDLVLDTTTYNGSDARDAVDTFRARTGRYVFISTGQVYLVRARIERPYREEHYDGPLIAEPEHGTRDHDSWRYGVEKREAEDVFRAAAGDLPVTTLRIPVVASERDAAGRIQAYVARLLDGGPILLPDDSGVPLRQLYVADLAAVIVLLADPGNAVPAELNVSYGQSMTLHAYLDLLGRVTGVTLDLVAARRDLLEQNDLLPACSPFSSRWMSELDNSASLAVLGSQGLRYTAPEEYLARIVADFVERWQGSALRPRGYEQRPRELRFAREISA